MSRIRTRPSSECGTPTRRGAAGRAGRGARGLAGSEGLAEGANFLVGTEEGGMLVAGGGQDLARVSSTLIVPTFQAAMRTHGDTVRGLETSSREAATVGIWGKIVRSPRE